MTRAADPGPAAAVDGAALTALLRARADALPDWLRAHTARVVAEARRLAQRHEVDLERVQAGAWGHDLYRAHGDQELLEAAGRLRLPLSEVERAAPVLLHGPIAAAVAEREWRVAEGEVLEAIRWHTTARPALSPVARTVFLADKIEPAKVAADPGLEPLRALAEHDPEGAMLALLERRIAQQLAVGRVVHPVSLEARNAYLLALAERSAAAP